MGLVHWFPTFGPAHFGNGGTKDPIVELLEAITTSTKSCSLSKMAHIKLVALVIHRLLLYLCVTIKNGYRQRKVI